MQKPNLNNLRLKISAGTPAQFPRDAIPQIAFSGRSNVGKSSLINTLLGRRTFARVSSAPGKTVTVNFFDIDGKLTFVDLPGYGYAKRSKEELLAFSRVTDGFFTKNPARDQLKLVLQLIDARTGPTDDDLSMIQYLVDTELPFLIVATKSDKLSKTALAKALGEMKETYFSEIDIPILPFSSETREGKDALWSEIYRALS
ncbi:MAG: YihA family ribosome biogenesis GTP-binding protein [Ruminococcaceae bacterium]|nr:YihA family ribosome biogenesis GTP-binding protein [Oscillospiraceae bacterium]